MIHCTQDVNLFVVGRNTEAFATSPFARSAFSVVDSDSPLLKQSKLPSKMTRKGTTTASILHNLVETLRMVQLALRDIETGTPERCHPAVRNIVVFGRAVTNVLQNLRSSEPEFDEWYALRVDEMRGDPLLRFFYKLRSEILKEGTLNTTVSAHIDQFEVPRDLRKFGPPPPNAIGFFIGDSNGGSGWEVRLPDGKTEKYYADLPGDIGQVTVEFRNAPIEHLGKLLPSTSIDVLCGAYVHYLERLVTDAQQRFGDRSKK